MAKRALMEHRPWLLASLVASISYFFVQDGNVPGIQLALWKGLGVGFLAVYASQRAKGFDGHLIAVGLAIGALADIAIQFSFLAGGALFALAHLVAIWLFLRNRREATTGSQRALGLVLLVAIPPLSALITMPRENWQLAVAYSVALAVMASAAWTSSFPRYRVGLGAVLFVISDLVIFAREANRINEGLAGWLVWPLYYAGQFMIATGVVQTLRHEKVIA